MARIIGPSPQEDMAAPAATGKEAVMMALPIVSSRVFEPGELAVLDEAFRLSWETLSAGDEPRFRDRQGYYARETIAKMVIGRATAGERDPRALSRSIITEMRIC